MTVTARARVPACIACLIYGIPLSSASAQSAQSAPPDLSGQALTPITAELAADFDDEVTAALARYDVPGAALAVVKDGQVAYAKGFGVRSLEDSRPVTTDTLFLIGSLTNAMTSMMMGSMVDDGLLQWDTNVTDVLPGFALSTPDSTPQIRIRDMLNHVSSVGDGASVLTVVS